MVSPTLETEYQQKESDNTLILQELQDIKKSVEATRISQQQFSYQLDKFPLLFTLREEIPKDGKIAQAVTMLSGFVQKVYRVHFLCAVCGEEGPSGRHIFHENGAAHNLKNQCSPFDLNQTGYRLVIPDKWVVDTCDILRVILDIASTVAAIMAIPFPRIPILNTARPVIRDAEGMIGGISRSLIHDRHNYRIRESVHQHPIGTIFSPPENRISEETEFSQNTSISLESGKSLYQSIKRSIRQHNPFSERTDARLSNPTNVHSSSSIDNESRNTDDPRAIDLCMTWSCVSIVQQLLDQVGDHDASKTGLERCSHRDDGFAWVCNAQKNPNCAQTYQRYGKSCCKLKVTYI